MPETALFITLGKQWILHYVLIESWTVLCNSQLGICQVSLSVKGTGGLHEGHFTALPPLPQLLSLLGVVVVTDALKVPRVLSQCNHLAKSWGHAGKSGLGLLSRHCAGTLKA